MISESEDGCMTLRATEGLGAWGLGGGSTNMAWQDLKNDQLDVGTNFNRSSCDDRWIEISW